MEMFLIVLVGLVAGFLGGLLGVGGGILLVPAFLFLLRERVPNIHMAVGTSMAVIIAISIAGTIWHAHNGRVNWQIVPLVAVFAVIGSFLGAHVSGYVGRLALRRIFAILLVAVAARMFFSRPAAPVADIDPPAGVGRPGQTAGSAQDPGSPRPLASTDGSGL